MSLVAVELFEQAYAQRSGTTVEWLHSQGRFGAPCNCGDDLCDGFQMLHLWSELVEAGWTPPAGAGRLVPALVAPDGWAEPDWELVERVLGLEETEARRAEWAEMLGRPTTRDTSESIPPFAPDDPGRAGHLG